MAQDDILIRMGMDASAFNAGLQKAKVQAKGLGFEIDSIFKAFTVAGALAGLRSLGESMLALRRQSEDLGASTDFLQSLGRMAVNFGGSAETANAALAKLAETIGAARTEGGAAAAKFAQFGIELYNLDGSAKNTEEVFKAIATAYHGSRDAATKASLAFEFFGKQGRDINNILGEGAAGIDAYTEKMKALGLVASAANVNAVADAWTNLKTNVSGGAASIAGFLTRVVSVQYQFLGALSAGVAPLNAIKQAWGEIWGGGKQKDALDTTTQQTEESKRLAGQMEKLLKLDEDIARVRRQQDEDTDAERLANLETEVSLAREAWKAEDDRVKKAEKLLELERAKLNLGKEAKRQDDDRAKALQQQADAMLAAVNAAQNRSRDLQGRVGEAETAREDRTKFTLGELAAGNLRGISDPKLRADILKAREVQRLESEAGFALNRGNRVGAEKLFSQADTVRSGIESLKSSEKLTEVAKGISSINEEVRKFNETGENLGFKVRPVFAK